MQMEYSGAVYAVILNDPGLRQGLVREAQRSRRAAQGTAASQALRVWLSATLHVLAARVDPTSGVLEPRSAGAL